MIGITSGSSVSGLVILNKVDQSHPWNFPKRSKNFQILVA